MVKDMGGAKHGIGQWDDNESAISDDAAEQLTLDKRLIVPLHHPYIK